MMEEIIQELDARIVQYHREKRRPPDYIYMDTETYKEFLMLLVWHSQPISRVIATYRGVRIYEVMCNEEHINVGGRY